MHSASSNEPPWVAALRRHKANVSSARAVRSIFRPRDRTDHPLFGCVVGATHAIMYWCGSTCPELRLSEYVLPTEDHARHVRSMQVDASDAVRVGEWVPRPTRNPEQHACGMALTLHFPVTATTKGTEEDWRDRTYACVSTVAMALNEHLHFEEAARVYVFRSESLRNPFVDVQVRMLFACQVPWVVQDRVETQVRAPLEDIVMRACNMSVRPRSWIELVDRRVIDGIEPWWVPTMSEFSLNEVHRVEMFVGALDLWTDESDDLVMLPVDPEPTPRQRALEAGVLAPPVRPHVRHPMQTSAWAASVVPDAFAQPYTPPRRKRSRDDGGDGDDGEDGRVRGRPNLTRMPWTDHDEDEDEEDDGYDGGGGGGGVHPLAERSSAGNQGDHWVDRMMAFGHRLRTDRPHELLSVDTPWDQLDAEATSQERIVRPASEAEVSLRHVVDAESLAEYVATTVGALQQCMSNYAMLELFHVAQMLPSRFYDPEDEGFTQRNFVDVAHALKHTDPRLFFAWLQLASQAPSFDYADVKTLYCRWLNLTVGKGKRKGTLYMWAKESDPKYFEEHRARSLRYLLEQVSREVSTVGVARVMFAKFHDEFVCVSYSAATQWYRFRDHRWQRDGGVTIRKELSENMYNVFRAYKEDLEKTAVEMANLEETPDVRAHLSRLTKRITNVITITQQLIDTRYKNNFLTEVRELMYDGHFLDNMNQSRHIALFKNGVFDLRERRFRPGRPDDMTDVQFGVNYYSPEEIRADRRMVKTLARLEGVLNDIFPNVDRREYMIDFLASCLFGYTYGQKITILHGPDGSNGKSFLMQLMREILKGAFGLLPLDYFINGRTRAGSTSNDLAALEHSRLALAQEPDEGQRVKSGMIKELSGCDTVQSRKNYQESRDWIPQFKIIIATNTLFEIRDTNDAVWRRIRRVKFDVRFLDDPSPEELENPLIRRKDSTLFDRIPEFAPIFASMLVQRALVTGCHVFDRPVILQDTYEYRDDQNIVGRFIAENLRLEPGVNLSKDQAIGAMHEWFYRTYARRDFPRPDAVVRAICVKFGEVTVLDKRRTKDSTGWKNVACDWVLDNATAAPAASPPQSAANNTGSHRAPAR